MKRKHAGSSPDEIHVAVSTPSKKGSVATQDAVSVSGLKSRAKPLFSTPTKAVRSAASTPSRRLNADRSARRKSARLLLEEEEDGETAWDGAVQLAEEILGEDEDDDDDDDDEEDNDDNNNNINNNINNDDGENNGEDDGLRAKLSGQQAAANGDLGPAEKTVATPKRRAGRPKGAKNKRSPTPEGDLPPHERYFFQNRAGPPRTSNNVLSSVSLPTHEEYFEKLASYTDPFGAGKEVLLELHRRSFPQWDFELDQGFNICLFGYGSKRQLVDQYAEWLYRKHSAGHSPSIVVVNGYTPNISMRSILATVAAAVLGEDAPPKLGAQPAEVLELLQTTLRSRSRAQSVCHSRPRARSRVRAQSQNQSSAGDASTFVLINSIDAPPLRRTGNQMLLARLAATPTIHMLATADTPNFMLMWDISLRDQFQFVFHDCTTFATYDAETDVVQEVSHLLGRKGRRVGGREGIGFVLKSLPENAQNLYRLLLVELLSMLHRDDDSDGDGDGDGDEEGVSRQAYPGEQAETSRAHERHDTGIDFRLLYQKASEEFIASSEMMFRTLLKEFHDHQMITSRIDPSGTEILGVPLARDEMEAVLEDLVLN